ncbi:MAG: hypothetical protein AB7I33_03990 [Gemmatimonadales bacterium]
MPPRHHLALGLLFFSLACAEASARRLAVPEIDTLPGGVVEVKNHGPTRWDDTTGWKLVETLRIGGGSGDSIVLNQPQSVALDDLGRVYVADDNPTVIKQFDADGRLIRTIGREGGGPGEFRVAFIAVHGADLVVHDPRQARTSVFDTSGTFKRSWSSLCCYWTSIVVDREGRVYIPGMSPSDSGSLYVRYDLGGTGADSMYLPPRPRDDRHTWNFKSNGRMMMSMGIPNTPRTLEEVNPTGGFLIGTSSEYRIAVTGSGRDTTLVFSRDWTPDPIPASRRQAIVDSSIKEVSRMVGEDAAREEIQVDDIPSTTPAFTGIAGDDRGNVWLQTDPGADTAHTRFDVFDSTGAYLGQVAGPRGMLFWRTAWKGNSLVVAMEDAEGNPVVIRYRVAGGE